VENKGKRGVRIGDKGAKNIGVSEIGKISSWKGGPKYRLLLYYDIKKPMLLFIFQLNRRVHDDCTNYK
jgi:hypothetical protein